MQISYTYAAGAAIIAASASWAAPAMAQTMDVSVTVPRLKVAEYHAPYIAFWIEKKGMAPRTLALWYDHDMKNNEGTKWLNSVRQWWRVSGRSMRFPAAGITGPTRPPGAHKISFTHGRGSMGTLGAGQYNLVIEAAREVGGREMITIPFTWPAKPGGVIRVSGKSELGSIVVSFRK